MVNDKEERVCLVPPSKEERQKQQSQSETRVSPAIAVAVSVKDSLTSSSSTATAAAASDINSALSASAAAAVAAAEGAAKTSISATKKRRKLRRSGTTTAGSRRYTSGISSGVGGNSSSGSSSRRVLVAKKASLVAIGSSKRHASKKISDHFNGINKLAQKRALMRSKQIDQLLLTDQEAKRKEIHLLLIGGNGCGKSTLVKQFRIHYGDAFPDDQRKALVGQVLENLADAVHIVLENMRTRDIWFHDPYIKDMMEEFQAYCPKFNSQIFRHSGKQVDIENSIHYAHVDFVDEDTLTSAPTDTDLPSSCCHGDTADLLLFDVGYREARRNHLDLNGLDGLTTGGGGGGGGDTASASLIIYYNTQGLEDSQSDTDERERERETHATRTYVSSLEFGKFSRRQRRQQQSLTASGGIGLEDGHQLDDASSDSSCARLVEHLHLGEAHDTDSSCGRRASSTLEGLPPHDEIVFCFVRHMKNCIVQPEFELCLADHEYFKPEITYAEMYFIQHVDRVIQEDYVPSLQDILAIRKPSDAVRQTEFQIAGTTFRMIDLAGQRSKRHKWIHYFEDVNAVLFVSSLSGFAELVEEEDRTTIKMSDCLSTFSEIITNKYLWKKDFFLFLNKLDAFEQKLKKKSITGLFPDYRGHDEVNQCAQYIKEKFLSLIPKNMPKSKKIYTHIITAIDIDSMKSLFKEVLHRVAEANLKKSINIF